MLGSRLAKSFDEEVDARASKEESIDQKEEEEAPIDGALQQLIGYHHMEKRVRLPDGWRGYPCHSFKCPSGCVCKNPSQPFAPAGTCENPNGRNTCPEINAPSGGGG